MKFCGQCGRPLEIPCAACGFANPPAFKFCGRCGASLAANPEPSPKPAPAQAERRQLTVMFCDVVGSTALSEQLDPEELREVIQAYQQTAVQAVNRFGGTVAQYLGDGILVYFGYPAAHENDAQRAVLAGLQVVGQMAALNRRLQQTINRLDDLAVRVGIHTGLVVVGQVGAGDTRVQLAIGETTNVAARLQSLARPNSVVISPATLRLVQGFFVIEPAGEHTLKGIRRPMPVYRVVQEAPVPTRLHAALAAGPAELTPLVGREQETALLL
ncbi:MAG: adenylate/guanylate cyclase domain-containing protein, partial [Chloroflexi bacterium]